MGIKQIGEFLTESEVAKLLRTSLRVVRNWRYSGEGPPYFNKGQSVLYRRDKVMEWVDGHTTRGEETEAGNTEPGAGGVDPDPEAA